MENEKEDEENAAPAPQKRYILARPEQLREYLEDRRRQYPSKANLQRRRAEQQRRQQARVLTDPTQPNHFLHAYQQQVRGNRVVMVKKQQASIIDRLIYDQQRAEISLMMEALEFIQEQGFMQEHIPQQFLQSYETRPFEITFEAPNPVRREDSSSGSYSESLSSDM